MANFSRGLFGHAKLLILIALYRIGNEFPQEQIRGDRLMNCSQLIFMPKLICSGTGEVWEKRVLGGISK